MPDHRHQANQVTKSWTVLIAPDGVAHANLYCDANEMWHWECLHTEVGHCAASGLRRATSWLAWEDFQGHEKRAHQ